ncbi:unnamed protein product [Parnassius mnemosyne]|uniref:Uncharacterized protein n=1 Tax=Parnassius mnemosyne TaxID=213953 RepID=A0AAV1LJH0_9NEOP
MEASEHISKRCKNCEVMELRLRYYQDRLDCMKHSNVELSKKMHEMDEKNEKVMSILTTIIEAKVSNIVCSLLK